MIEQKKKTLWNEIVGVIGAVFLALAIRTFIFSPYVIPSGSMIPSLLIGDFLFVTKYSYGVSRFSFPFGYLVPLFEGRILSGARPKQGDVVVFRLPNNPGTDFIKRVIGVPGDRIQVKEGILYVNDVEAKLERIEDYTTYDDDGSILMAPQYTETLPNGVKHPILKKKPFGEGRLDNTMVYVVPEGHYFMMGDNRDGSEDSRVLHTIGYIPEDHLIGQAQFTFFSVDSSAQFYEFWKWFSAMRFERFFRWIR